jgi:uncharacterized membrane protein YkvA (DUF1232 family)
MTTDQEPENIPADSPSDSKAIALITNQAVRRAERIAKKPDRVVKLLESARIKADRSRDSIRSAWDTIGALIRMLRAHFSHTYSDLPWRSIVWGLAALIYFVAPLDMIPDFILGGLVDDAAVVMYVVRQIQKDLDAFLAWESQQPADNDE